MYDREPRIEDFPLREVPAPVKGNNPGPVPDKYFSGIGKFWNKHSVVLWTIGTVVLMFLLGALTMRIPPFGAIFGIGMFVVMIAFPVSAFVSRKNGRLQYEKDVYNKQVQQYQNEVERAKQERETAFRRAHDVWMTQQGRISTPAPVAADSGLVSRFKNSSVTKEIAEWIKTGWEGYGKNRGLDPQIQEFETFCEGNVERSNVSVTFSLKDQNACVTRNQYYFEQHKTQSLGSDEDCAAVAAALASILQSMQIDYKPVTIRSQNGTVFIARRTAPNPNYAPPYRGW